MASLAEQVFVAAAKREPRVAVVLEQKMSAKETLVDVTVVAALFELAEVHVLVAGAAERLDRLVTNGGGATLREQGVRFAKVTFFTGKGRMFPRQRIAALIVVECGPLKALDVVTATAILLELTHMRVLTVAVVTLLEGESPEVPLRALGAGEVLPVALVALDIDVLTLEREPRLAVIESGALPRSFIMATAAIGPERGLVRVAVAVGAARVAKARPFAVAMAPITVDLSMGA